MLGRGRLDSPELVKGGRCFWGVIKVIMQGKLSPSPPLSTMLEVELPPWSASFRASRAGVYFSGRTATAYYGAEQRAVLRVDAGLRFPDIWLDVLLPTAPQSW